MFTLPGFYFPGAGGNWQEIMTRWMSPNIQLNFAGNAAIEREVSEEVASYGTQINWLNDIVLALCDALPAGTAADPKAAAALAKLKAAQVKIDEIVARRKGNALARAQDALKDLRAADAEGYRRLLGSLDRPPDAA